MACTGRKEKGAARLELTGKRKTGVGHVGVTDLPLISVVKNSLSAVMEHFSVLGFISINGGQQGTVAIAVPKSPNFRRAESVVLIIAKNSP